MLDPEYLDPEAENVLVKLPEGVPLGASGHEDTLIVSLLCVIYCTSLSLSCAIIQQENGWG